MPTEAEIQKQCQRLINAKWPQMPFAWRYLTARKAARNWANDHITPRGATPIMSDNMKADVAMDTPEPGVKGSGSEPPAQNARQAAQARAESDEPQNTRPTAKHVSGDDPTGQTSDSNTPGASEGSKPGAGTIVNDPPLDPGQTTGPPEPPPEPPTGG